MFIPGIPDLNFFPSRIRIFSFPDPRSASKNFSILTQKMVSKLSDIRSELFILDPDPDLFTHPRSRGQKKAPDPGSKSATLGGKTLHTSLKAKGTKGNWMRSSAADLVLFAVFS
jgi:hypothetical protein